MIIFIITYGNMRRRFLITTNLFTQQPKNQIWYTSTNNEVVTPYTIHLFGVNIVSNTYSGGKGIIKFEGDIKAIGDSAFYDCTSLTSVNIPDSVTKIGDSAFFYCTSLTSVTIGESVTTIGGSAFESCTSLTSVNIPDSVTKIGDSAFFICGSLTSVIIPDSVTEIGYLAFKSCHSLTSVTIGESVTSIRDEAFAYCDSLTSVYCKATTPPALGWGVFDTNGSGRKIYVPTESVDAYKSATNWSEYADAIIGYNFN